MCESGAQQHYPRGHTRAPVCTPTCMWRQICVQGRAYSRAWSCVPRTMCGYSLNKTTGDGWKTGIRDSSPRWAVVGWHHLRCTASSVCHRLAPPGVRGRTTVHPLLTPEREEANVCVSSADVACCYCAMAAMAATVAPCCLGWKWLGDQYKEIPS